MEARVPAGFKGEIRNFLYLFVDAFAFPRTRALQFAPTDQVLSVYRALYPIRDGPTRWS
jgi:propanediol dehydratase small subunit